MILVARFSKSTHMVNILENLARFGFSKRLFGRGLHSGSQIFPPRNPSPLLLTSSPFFCPIRRVAFSST